MGKALVLKSVDFSSVAVDKVTIGDEVPCTAVSLNKSTLSFAKVADTDTLVATLTPSNTTDELVWTSSNENVATVEDGVVTIHGIGTATITATCGNASATATVTQTSIKAQYDIYKTSDVYLDKLSTDNGIIVKVVSGSGTIAVGQAYHNDDKVRIKANNPVVEMIKVPYGATIAKVSTTDGVAVSVSYTYIADSEDLVTYDGKEYPKFVERKEFVNTGTGMTIAYGKVFAFRPTATQASTFDYVYFE